MLHFLLACSLYRNFKKYNCFSEQISACQTGKLRQYLLDICKHCSSNNITMKIGYRFLSVLTVHLCFKIVSVHSLPAREKCPEVRPMTNFNIFNILGSWYVVQYYSSSEEALTYHCMRAEFGLSSGYMDMIMRLTYIYADDPGEESQTGNMTWQIPDPRRPEHWRHTENPYKGVYNTDVIDTDYTSWLILLHCSDPESEKKFLSTFVLSRTAYIDKLTTDYLREKIGQYNVPMEYLFPVNQTFCFGEPDGTRCISGNFCPDFLTHFKHKQ